ncbi:MAG: sulfate permease [Ignavibacteriales bacterium]|nr:MAG: sulfate permease [Ignavibacteriales bacterium]
MLKPQLFSTLKDYNKNLFFSDVTSGLIVGIVALPLAIAFAIASGVTPEKGLITAIIGGFIISALGGSKVQIGGPTGAFVVIVYSIIADHGLNGLFISTIMAGVILIIMGLVKFGSVIKFIPHPVVVGFTSGIALIIFASQVKDFFGLNIETLPADFIDKIDAYLEYFYTINLYSFFIGAGSLILLVFWPKLSHKIPGSLVVLILSTAAVAIFNLPVETIGSRFGEISSAISPPEGFEINLTIIRDLIQPATTIAILAAIESLLSAVVADGMIGGKHRSNMELVAQGAANIVVPFFGGIPATGAIARTATNIKNGGRTPIAGITHAIVLLLIMLFFGQWAKLIPLPALAAILVIVAYNMSEWRTFRSLLKSPKSDVAVLLTTFFLTVIFDLTIAIEIGMVLAVFLFMRRMAMVSNVGVITRELTDDVENIVDPMSIDKKNVPEGVEVFEINGPFFFGAVEKFKEAAEIIEKPPKVRIIRMRNVPAIDSTGLHVLEEVLRDSRKEGTEVIFSGVHAQPLMAFDNSGLLKKIGEDNVHSNIDEALARAKEILERITDK